MAANRKISVDYDNQQNCFLSPLERLKTKTFYERFFAVRLFRRLKYYWTWSVAWIRGSVTDKKKPIWSFSSKQVEAKGIEKKDGVPSYEIPLVVSLSLHLLTPFISFSSFSLSLSHTLTVSLSPSSYLSIHLYLIPGLPFWFSFIRNVFHWDIFLFSGKYKKGKIQITLAAKFSL